MLNFDLCIMEGWEDATFATLFLTAEMGVGMALAVVARLLRNLTGGAINPVNFGLGCLAPTAFGWLLVQSTLILFLPRGGCGQTPDAVIMILFFPLFIFAAMITFALRVIRQTDQ